MLHSAHLTLGEPAAERDSNLETYFLESPIFAAFKDRRVSILIGNRGSGKSAIFKMLGAREERAGTHVIRINPEDYSYEMLRDTLGREIASGWSKQGAYHVSWKYVLWILTMRALRRSTYGSKSSLREIATFLRDRIQGEQLGVVEHLISYMKRVQGLKVGSFQLSFNATQLSSLYKLQKIDEIKPCILDLLNSNRVLILVDELDRGWDASEDARQFVAGLFQAAIQMNQISPGLRVLISIRRELYDNIPEIYEDAQKVRDLMIHLEWKEDELKEMISRRIQHVIGGYASNDRDLIWTQLFVEQLDYRKAKSFNYVVDRTLFRPRELIQFCNECISARSDSRDLIDYDTIAKAEVVYSRARTQDIAAEYRFQYPSLLEVLECFRGACV